MENIHISRVDNVQMLDGKSQCCAFGTLHVTATHILFVDYDQKLQKWMLHSLIQSFEKSHSGQNKFCLRIRFKTFEAVTIIVTNERDYNNLYSSLVKIYKPENIEGLYAFSFKPPLQELKQSEGWNFFSLQSEYFQMGLPNRHWKLSKINDKYDLCETYPKLLCVPSLAKSTLLAGSAAFRSKKRLPVLTYLHENGSFIARCSQPMVGLNSRSIEDEYYVNMIRQSKSCKNTFMYIVDTRPLINAVANRAKGKGYENTNLYENIKYRFLGIENIHVMRNSLNKLLEACEDSSCSMGVWMEAVNNSGWLKHVHNIIQVSGFIANAVGVEDHSVLVHCSDGWDRTTQTCALASVMLNARYRTVEGFLALIQKEWLHFGHKFQHRCGHLKTDVKETSPIFTQFIDAVWQLMRLNQTFFQFNELLLFDLHEHIYSCQFGTFLGNSSKMRQECSIASRTYSLWGWMMKRLHVYTNPCFCPAMQQRTENQLLLPPTTDFVKLWTGMYSRFQKGPQPRAALASIVKVLHGDNLQSNTSSEKMCPGNGKMTEGRGVTAPSGETKHPSDIAARASCDLSGNQMSSTLSLGRAIVQSSSLAVSFTAISSPADGEA